MSIFEPVFQTLNAADVRYVVVGGLATVLHGYARLTADIDLAVDLAPEAAGRVIIDDLIDLKRRAGRPQDLADIVQLEAIRKRKGTR